MVGARGARVRGVLEGALIAAFAACLIAPCFARWVRPPGRATSAEFRKLARKPALRRATLSTYPERFEAFANDRFGLREALLRGRSLVAWFVLGVSPTDKMVRGRGDWIFYTENDSLEVLRGALPLSRGELDAWTRMLTGRRDWLAELGVEFVFAVVPNKDQIYPEFLPARLGPPGRTRLDQLLEHLARHSDVRVLDLRGALLAAKVTDRPALDDWTYARLGTHWSARGAFAGYQALIDRLRERFATLPRLERGDFELLPTEGEGETWAPRMYLEGALHQSTHRLEFVGRPAARYSAAKLASARDVRAQHQREDLPTAIVVHDSYGPPLRPWLAESFARTNFVWSNGFDAARIAAERPDVVLQVRSERVLAMMTPQLTSLEDGAGNRQAFAQSRARVWHLDPHDATTHPDPVGRARLEWLPRGGLAITTSGGRDRIELPEFALPAGPAVLRIELESPADTTLDLFFHARSGAEEDRALKTDLRTGANERFVHLPAVGIAGRLQLRPGLEPGTYVLRALEIRE